MVDMTNPDANLTLAEEILAGAQNIPQGRARIALGAALSDTPGWSVPPAFIDFKLASYLRPFDAFTHRCDSHRGDLDCRDDFSFGDAY